MLTNKEYMFVHETAGWLLSHFKCLETRPINEFKLSENRFVFRLCFERDVFKRHQVDKQWVEFFPVKL